MGFPKNMVKHSLKDLVLSFHWCGKWKIYCYHRIICFNHVFLNEWNNALSGNRIGWNTNYWRLCNDLACCYKGSITVGFLEDLADNTQSWLYIWEVRSCAWFEGEEKIEHQMLDFLDPVFPFSVDCALDICMLVVMSFLKVRLCAY